MPEFTMSIAELQEALRAIDDQHEAFADEKAVIVADEDGHRFRVASVEYFAGNAIINIRSFASI
jgi:hypothetical protein